MDMESVNSPVRFDIKAEAVDFAHFIDAVKSAPQLTQVSFTPADEKNHFVIYKFTDDGFSGAKCVVVYDTKACKISLTAKTEVLEKFKQLYIKRDSILSEREEKKSGGVPAVAPHHNNGRLPASHSKSSKLPQKQTLTGKEAQVSEKRPPLPQKQQDKPQPPQNKATTPNKQQPSQSKPQQPQKTATKKPVEAAAAKTEADQPPEYKNGYTIKKYTRRRLDDALVGIKAMKGVTYRSDAVANKGKPDEAETYVVSGKNSLKVILRYMPKKEMLQMQGKRSYLFSEVQVLLLKDADFSSAVGSHIEAETGKKNTQSGTLSVQRRLKKILPDAFDYLSEQSKIDLTIGYIDINSTETKLSDYSSLLTPPYRGLEKFICDLQKARGIEVKMIGQGYEKDDLGNYRLKSGYRRRIDSVVYNEVMSSLYTEYFSRRNFYTHSDFSSDGTPRIITDKAEVKKIFDNLIEVINYNSKKLKEIGFTI